MSTTLQAIVAFSPSNRGAWRCGVWRAGGAAITNNARGPHSRPVPRDGSRGSLLGEVPPSGQGAGEGSSGSTPGPSKLMASSS